MAGPLLCLMVWLILRRLRRSYRLAEDSARRLDGAAATGHELVWEIDGNGIVTYMSDVALDLFGVDPRDLVGQSVFTLLPPEGQPRARSLLADSVRERRGWKGLVFEAPDGHGSMRWVETSGVAHLDEHGDVRGFTATTRAMDPEAVQQISLGQARERVQLVIAEERLTTVFQPIVNVASGDVVGCEALSRFDTEPRQGPDRWFADAEHVGLGVELDLLAAQKALHAAQHLPWDTYVSINVTPSTLQSGRVAALVDSAPLPGDRIVIEITEHVSVVDYQTLRDPLAQLRAKGVRLAVDDAGAGYASFRHILRLRPEFIKLDREIISGMHNDAARRALAGAVVMFALDVGATVIAEGVETPDELAIIATLGIDAVQGYLLGRPTADLRDFGRSRRPEIAEVSQLSP
jgi:PAS domain S-box-containing protein